MGREREMAGKRAGGWPAAPGEREGERGPFPFLEKPGSAGTARATRPTGLGLYGSLLAGTRPPPLPPATL